MPLVLWDILWETAYDRTIIAWIEVIPLWMGKSWVVPHKIVPKRVGGHMDGPWEEVALLLHW